MNTLETFKETKRLTTAEEVFQRLSSDIVSMHLKPGEKLSEVEVARQFEVSRQPVREAFARLGDLNLLQIRPQKATLVRKISREALKTTRFIRASIEVEVVRKACGIATKESLSDIRRNLELQKNAVSTKNSIMMHKLDYEFHRLICVVADCVPAFKIIAENKAHTDRVCVLELSNVSGMNEVFEGHANIIRAIADGDEEEAVRFTRHHLAHLDDTLRNAQENYGDYFED